MRVDDQADRDVVVDCGDKIGDILRYIHLVEPLAGLKRLGAVGQVGAEHTVDHALLIRLVEALEAVCEDGVGGIGEDAARRDIHALQSGCAR